MIRSARKARGISQANLARSIGTRQSAISRLEKNQISPTFETLDKILSALGADLEFRLSLSKDFDADELAHDRAEMTESWNRLAGQLSEAGKKVARRP